MFKFIIKGKAFKIGDDIDTDQIYPGRYLYLTSAEEIASHAMEDTIPDFSKKVAGKDWIIVGGKNFWLWLQSRACSPGYFVLWN